MTPEQRKLVEDHLDIPQIIVGRSRSMYYLNDELIGVADEALCLAAIGYHPESGASFKTFAYQFVAWRINDFLRSWSGRKRRTYVEITEDHFPSMPSHEDEVVDHQANLYLRDQLVPNVRELYDAMETGLTLKQIAALKGVDKSAISQRFNKERARLGHHRNNKPRSK